MEITRGGIGWDFGTGEVLIDKFAERENIAVD